MLFFWNNRSGVRNVLWKCRYQAAKAKKLEVLKTQWKGAAKAKRKRKLNMPVLCHKHLMICIVLDAWRRIVSLQKHAKQQEF